MSERTPVPSAAPAATDPLLELLRREMPVSTGAMALDGTRCGLVVIDEQNGFATVGAGPLAPAAPDALVDRMIAETDSLARLFRERDLPILVFLDHHHPDRPEPPYPPHCIAGTGQEDLVPALAWLGEPGAATQVRTDCINDFVGSIDPATGRNAVVDWIATHRLMSLLVVGICTDICVAEFVTSMLSARNHGIVPPLREVVVYEPGCATYDLPRDAAVALGLPETAAHPQSVAHHLGLWLMASRGARLAARIE